MGALKLTYYEKNNPLKVAYRATEVEKNNVQRFLSIDPLTREYAWYTPYQFAGNKPIWAIDLDGAEELIRNVYLFNGRPWLTITSYIPISDRKPNTEGKYIEYSNNTNPRSADFNKRFFFSTKD